MGVSVDELPMATYRAIGRFVVNRFSSEKVLVMFVPSLKKKIMKTLIVSIAFLLSILFCNAQDYFEVVVTSQETTYNYPENSLLTLTDEDGSSRKIDKEDYIKVTGNYTVTVDVPWSETPDIIESNGESLEIRKLPESDYKYNTIELF